MKLLDVEMSLREGYEVSGPALLSYALTDDGDRDFITLKIPWWSRRWWSPYADVYRSGWHWLCLCWAHDESINRHELRVWRERRLTV